MKLQTKLLIGLLAGVLTTFVVSALVQQYLAAESASRFARRSLEGEERRHWKWVEVVQHATQASLVAAMAEGDMDRFQKLLAAQRTVPGVQDLSLYDAKGRIAYSSDSARLKQELPPDLKQNLLASTNELVRRTETSFEMYQPLSAEKRCVDCHTDWSPNQLVGVLAMRFSDADLKSAEQTWVAFEKDSVQSGILTAAITAVILISVVTVVAFLAVHYLMTLPLKRIAATVSVHSRDVAHAAGAVGTASQSLAQNTREQAAATQRISASLVEVSGVAGRNAENARHANSLAKGSHAAAQSGASDTQEMCAAMRTIEHSSNDISKIIKTIDEIAFQTNILALNAAVEAARAGEMGCGFAVVADEVRALAQRSAAAARETSTKIDAAITRTCQGVQLSVKVADALNDILSKSAEVGALDNQMDAASREQTQALSQINDAVTRMDKTTQNNAASAGATASAADQLSVQAAAMNEVAMELLTLVTGKAVQPALAPAPVVQPPVQRQVVHPGQSRRSVQLPASRLLKSR